MTSGRRHNPCHDIVVDRWHTLCDDGTRAVSHYQRILERWETTIMSSPHTSFAARLQSSTNHIEILVAKSCRGERVPASTSASSGTRGA
jgi:hypothetical protein